MTKAELVREVSRRCGMFQRDVQMILEEVALVVKGEVSKGGRVQLPGLAIFTRVERAARQGVNPQTGKPIKIAKHMAVKIRPTTALKTAVR
jgi:DNA-binding protein HU-beta